MPIAALNPDGFGMGYRAYWLGGLGMTWCPPSAVHGALPDFVLSSLIRFWFDLAQRHTALYLSICCLLGLLIRYRLAAADWTLFLDPRFPLLSWLD